MKDADTYLREFSNPPEHIREIVQRAQQDAYQEGYRSASTEMYEIVEQSKARVTELTRRPTKSMVLNR